MCQAQRRIWAACAHWVLEAIECLKYASRRDKHGRRACTAKRCQHSPVRFVLAFCEVCTASFSGEWPIDPESLLAHYWIYKALKEWDDAVDPSMFPVDEIFHKDWELKQQQQSVASFSKTKKTWGEGEDSGRYVPWNGISFEEMSVLRVIDLDEQVVDECARCRAGEPGWDLVRLLPKIMEVMGRCEGPMFSGCEDLGADFTPRVIDPVEMEMQEVERLKREELEKQMEEKDRQKKKKEDAKEKQDDERKKKDQHGLKSSGPGAVRLSWCDAYRVLTGAGQHSRTTPYTGWINQGCELRPVLRHQRNVPQHPPPV